MDDLAPPSLESRLLLERLQADRTYPFLRIARWIIWGVAAIYGALGLLASVTLMAGDLEGDTRERIVALGGPATGTGVFVGLALLIGVGLRIVLLLAVAEGIKLLLDSRQAQRELAAAHRDLAETLSKVVRVQRAPPEVS